MSSMMLRKGVRNPEIVKKGKACVSLLHNTIDKRMIYTINQEGTASSSSSSTSTDMSCTAVLTAGAKTYAKAYDSKFSLHAEMSALASFVKDGGAISDIDKIVISSPPCLHCAFVLWLLGIPAENIHTTGLSYKKATSSWAWPKELANHELFETTRWRIIQAWFDGSNLPEGEICTIMMSVVRTGAVY